MRYYYNRNYLERLMMADKNHILIVDDDDRIRELLNRFLIKNNFIVSAGSNTEEAKFFLNKYVIDLIILDCMMPNESGIEFLNKLRQQNNHIPVIMLTALGDVENRIEGLSYGADDYIGKPFEPKELVLRVNNILKRTGRIAEKKSEFMFGNFIFNLEKNELWENNDLIKLTDTEIKILKIFFEHKDQILTREELCNFCDDINERSVDVQITRLRKKIESNPKNPNFLKTIRNKGYLFSI